VVRQDLARFDRHVLQPTWQSIASAALPGPLKAYIAFLEKQAQGKFKGLPRWMRIVLETQGQYDFDLGLVSYAEGINTVHGMNITFGYNIFCTGAVALEQSSASAADVALILHELEHVSQYRKHGGLAPFLVKYVVNAGAETIKLVSRGEYETINLHDSINLERDAENKSQRIKADVMAGLHELSLNRATKPGKHVGAVLAAGDDAAEGDFLQSTEKDYRLIVQGDGNLVVYNGAGTPIWSSQTDGKLKPPYKLSMQTDGNLVLYAQNGVVWATNTDGSGSGNQLRMQTDGNLVLYDRAENPLWASGSQGK
jgi:hypothetical protein